MLKLQLCTLFISLAPLACDSANDPPAELTCPSATGPFRVEDSRVTGSLAFDPPSEPLGRGDTLFVSGTAFHEDGLAIREIRVAGVATTRDEFNFARWSASVPYEAIITASPTANAQVAFDAVAIDACGKRYPFATAVVEVDPSPHVDVETLVVNVEYPEDWAFIPASGSVPAIITIVGTGRAAGAVVSVSVDAGDLRGLDESGQIILAAPPGETDTGTAAIIFTPSEAGTATIIVTVEDKLAVGLVRVVGPPALSPRRATLVPGSSIEIDVSGATDLRCTAGTNPDFEISHFGAPLSSEPMAIEVDEGGRRVIVVAASADPIATDSDVVVTCSDDFAQLGSGRYRLGDETFVPDEPDGEPLPEEEF